MLSHFHNCNGPILLVGEGDFSFASSLRKHLPQVSMVATCIDDTSTGKYFSAEENIRQLTEAGVIVIYGVDATSLETCKRLEGWKFEIIVFNFPHTGRKTHIQDNRKLIRNFFTSASRCVTSNGQILITLCNGQGGTPADKPQREWCNSWQVVSMATYADLILTHTEEFIAAEFPEYTCTGYRGRDKSFNTVGAVTHVFERFPLQEIDSSPVVLHCQRGGNNHMLACPEDLETYFTRNLIQETFSPVHEVYSRISNRCKFLVNDLLIEETKKCDWIEEVNKKWSEQLVYKLKEINVKCIGVDHTNNQSSNTIIGADLHTGDSSDVCPVVDSRKNSQNYNFVLSPSVKHCKICRSDHERKTGRLVVGPAFRQCSINPKVFPITNELKLFLPEKSCKLSIAEVVSSIIHAVNPEMEIIFKPLKANLDMLSDYCNIERSEVLEKTENLNITQETLQRLSELSLNSPRDTPHLGIHSGISKHHIMQRSIWLDSIIDMEPTACSANIDKFHVIIASLNTTVDEVGLMGRITDSNNGDGKIVIIVNMDLLAMLCYNILDVRLLWLNNSLIKLVKAPDSLSYVSYSKYSPCYIRDQNFLVKSEEPFPEMKFFLIIRKFCGCYIKSVDLIDVYKEPNTQLYSLGYRFVYQSHTIALSRSKVNNIHEYLCCQLESHLSINIRT